jgi:hypothetical protein
MSQELTANLPQTQEHTQLSENKVQDLRAQLSGAQLDLQRTQQEGQAKVDAVVRDAENRHQQAMTAERDRISQLVRENQHYTAAANEVAQQKLVCQSESVAFQRACEVFEQHSEVGDKKLAREFEARAMEAHKEAGQHDAEAQRLVTQEQKASQELATMRENLQQVEQAEAAKAVACSRDARPKRKRLALFREERRRLRTG